MMLAYRLLRLVEKHSEALAAGLLERHKTPHCSPGYRNVPPGNLSNGCTKSIAFWRTGFLARASWTSKSDTQKLAPRGCQLAPLIWASFT